MSVIPDHYATLGVEPNTPAAAIRKAYLALMREYHPDRNPSPEATLRAQAVIAAFKVLGDFDRRNHYDWDRRREREAAAAAVAAEPRRNRASAIAAGGLGLAALGAWLMVPTPTPRPEPAASPVAEARESPLIPTQRTLAPKRVAVASPAKTEVARPPASTRPELRAPAVRVAAVEPPRPRPEVVTVRPQAEVKPPPEPRIAAAKPLKPPPPRVVPAPPPARTAAAEPKRAEPLKRAEPAKRAEASPKAAPDLASLDRFVMNFYGQSWRYGDAPKRAALEQSRNAFIVKRGSCAADSCKRAAYLGLMRDVSKIVEAGPPKAR